MSLKIGCHVSISGGIERSVMRAKKLGINTMQIFSKNSLTWKERIYTEEEIVHFQRALVKTSIYPVFVHTSYLINLASPDETIYLKSIDAFLEEMKRTHLLLADLWLPYLIVHPGAHLGAGEDDGLRRVIRALNMVLEKSHALDFSTMILLENTSGLGTSLGYTFKQLGDILSGVTRTKNIGICMDTCHAYASGYNLSTKEGLEETLENIKEFIDFKKLKVIHLNDSKFPLGSKKDRHMHIGKGYIGEKGFRYLLNHVAFKDIPYILETPKNCEEDDLRNIRFVQKMRKIGIEE